MDIASESEAHHIEKGGIMGQYQTPGLGLKLKSSISIIAGQLCRIDTSSGLVSHFGTASGNNDGFCGVADKDILSGEETIIINDGVFVFNITQGTYYAGQFVTTSGENASKVTTSGANATNKIGWIVENGINVSQVYVKICPIIF